MFLSVTPSVSYNNGISDTLGVKNFAKHDRRLISSQDNGSLSKISVSSTQMFAISMSLPTA